MELPPEVFNPESDQKDSSIQNADTSASGPGALLRIKRRRCDASTDEISGSNVHETLVSLNSKPLISPPNDMRSCIHCNAPSRP